MRLLTSNIWSSLAIRPNVQRKSVELAAGAFTLLHCNRNQPGKRRRRRADLGTAFWRFKAHPNPWPILGVAIALKMKINFGVPKCRTGAVDAARVHRAKSLRNFPKCLFDCFK
jgi:hypothetical protein